MNSLKNIVNKIVAVAHSSRGHNFLLFGVFLAIATVLWLVMALNEEAPCDIRLPLRISNIPDSITLVANPPKDIAVSLRTRGTQLLKLNLGQTPVVTVDFRAARSKNVLQVNNIELKNIVRSTLGGANVLVVNPDSLNVPFTSSPGLPLPIVVDYCATAGPQASIIGTPRTSVDTVRVYSVNRLPANLEAIVTEPIRINGLKNSTSVKVKLVAPDGARVIPDSVDVSFDVEPLILKTRKVVVEPINVPADRKLILFPAQVDVIYMIPMSDYKTSEPRLRVVADYNTINTDKHTRNMRIRLTDVSSSLQNVHLAADSAEFIIEKL